MRVSVARIKQRFAQFQKDGVRVRATLELNAGVKKPPPRGIAITSSPCKESFVGTYALGGSTVEKNEQ